MNVSHPGQNKRQGKFILPGLNEQETKDSMHQNVKALDCETKDLSKPSLHAERHRPKETLKYLMSNMEKVLTPQQLQKFCILDEGLVLGEFTTLEAAQKAQRNVWSNICTFLYIPPNDVNTNIKSKL